MGADASPEAIKKEVRVYLLVFLTLGVLTAVTVLAAELELNLQMTILLAMAIATVKGTLVAGSFMHLFHEKKVIYWLLILSVFFLIVCLVLPVFTTLGYWATEAVE